MKIIIMKLSTHIPRLIFHISMKIKLKCYQLVEKLPISTKMIQSK